ncbi:rhomboid family intramembrane serine protease [Sphingobacterium detergens]|uniref:Rhomboid family protein n=1 Tax=Sphingobacterium detergens TaxID=1145106 RepID=A0A420AJ03_SPHD1|nr:rhomboid family intramembrane serine protease [Sphingobacterium detergens]RKE44548.1 rhomboid family protein [Sphingobacterium detergens]
MKFFDIFPTFSESPYSYTLVPVVMICSTIGFYYKPFFHALILHPYEIANGKRTHTLFTSALIHRGWLHLLFNCIVIFSLVYDMTSILKQEFGQTVSYLVTPILVLTLIVLPNLCQTYLHRKNFIFTSIGASGLSLGLYGFSALFFPLQKINHLFVPWIHNSAQYWIYILLLLILSSFIKNTKINRSLHLIAFILGSVLALLISPYTVELREAFN